MKWIYILSLVTFFQGVQQEVYAEIRNGYEPYTLLAERNIRNLHGLAQGTMSKSHRVRLNKFLKATYTKAERVKENYARTQQLLEDLRMVDPALYHEINTLKDRKGNETHVYIKVVDELGPRFLGINNIAQSLANPHVYTSEYGDHTVSVMVV